MCIIAAIRYYIREELDDSFANPLFIVPPIMRPKYPGRRIMAPPNIYPKYPSRFTTYLHNLGDTGTMIPSA